MKCLLGVNVNSVIKIFFTTNFTHFGRGHLNEVDSTPFQIHGPCVFRRFWILCLCTTYWEAAFCHLIQICFKALSLLNIKEIKNIKK